VPAKFPRILDVVSVEEFPRDVAGKTQKREMRDSCAHYPSPKSTGPA
jgi:hypothetical protein